MPRRARPAGRSWCGLEPATSAPIAARRAAARNRSLKPVRYRRTCRPGLETRHRGPAEAGPRPFSRHSMLEAVSTTPDHVTIRATARKVAVYLDNFAIIDIACGDARRRERFIEAFWN